MNTRKAIDPLVIPLLGSLPLILFLIFDFLFSTPISIATGLGVCLILSLFFRQKSPCTLILSGFIFNFFLLLHLAVSLRGLLSDYSGIFFELSTILFFFVFLRFESLFQKKIQKRNTSNREFQLVCFNFNIYVIRIFLFILILHLSVVLVYSLLPNACHSSGSDQFMHHTFLFILLGGYFLYESIHIRQLRHAFKNEIWLPIVVESGLIRGKIAASVSKETGNKHLHPIVRIALIYKGKLYLKKRNDSELLDYPFESNVIFKESLDDTVGRTFTESGENPDLPSRFIFRYVTKNEQSNRLIYLYTSLIRDNEAVQNLRQSSGKWWTSQQIRENMSKGIFSEYFEKEFEFLNNTVLLADRIYSNLEQIADN